MLAPPEPLHEAGVTSSLGDVLSHSIRQIPLYAKTGAALSAGESPTKQLQRWPLITKEDIRRSFPANFLGAADRLEQLLELDEVELEHTSGTSEERTPLLLPRGWWARQELRALELNALSAEVLRENPQARRATINSPVCSGDIRYHGVPARSDRIVENSLFVSLSRYPFLWSQRELDRMAQEITEWAPDFLDVDPVYAVVFALHCERHGIRLPSLRFVLCSYEFVSQVHRALLQRVWRVPVFDLYGSTETGHLLMEDTAGKMRPSSETAFLEVLESDHLGIGHLVVTTLTNPIMPLIRYRIGDLVERHATPGGLSYHVHGRAADAFTIASGRRVTTRQIDQCFAGIKGIAHYQLIQRRPESWVLRFVPDVQPAESSVLAGLSRRLEDLLQSSAPVSIEQTDILAPERSGKFRLGYPAKV
jgi:phenylacetate-CoA ligase